MLMRPTTAHLVSHLHMYLLPPLQPARSAPPSAGSAMLSLASKRPNYCDPPRCQLYHSMALHLLSGSRRTAGLNTCRQARAAVLTFCSVSSST